VLLVVTPAIGDEVTAVSIGGKGELTKCSYEGCLLYHHVAVPLRLSVGDKVRLWYGSNPKYYVFPIARILANGNSCIAFSQLNKTDNVDKIEFLPCKVRSGVQ
jgi:hypothetical protein